MQVQIRKAGGVLGMALALMLSACGGETDDGYPFEDWQSEGGQWAIAKLRLRAGTQELAPGGSVAVGQKVVLDMPAESASAQHRWQLTRAPQGSAASLQADTGVMTELVPDIAGVYVVSATVERSQGQATGTAMLVAVGDAPVAVTHGTMSALVGSVLLDGSASVPPSAGKVEGLSYAWRLVASPEGSSLRGLSAGQAAQAVSEVTVDVPGLYEFELAVGYDGKVSPPASLAVLVTGIAVAPEARISASSSQVQRDERVRLDGTRSVSGSGKALQYRWAIASMPASIRGTAYEPVLEAANQAEASFLPRAAGNYGLTLQVYDGVLPSVVARTTVRVQAQTTQPPAAPVARITLEPDNASGESEKDVRIRLDGTSSYALDEPNDSRMEYAWTLVEYPQGYVHDADAETWKKSIAQFTPTQYGQYVIDLRVRVAGGDWSPAARQIMKVMDGANRAPLAFARLNTVNSNVMVGQSIQLNGAGSSDPDSNALRFSWSLQDRPDGSRAALSANDVERPVLVPDVGGPYVVELVVTDSHGISSRASRLALFAKEKNLVPLVMTTLGDGRYYGQDQVPQNREQPLLIGQRWRNVPHEVYMQDHRYIARLDHWNSFNLQSYAFDPEGDPLVYAWRLISEPSGVIPGNVPANAQCAVGGRWTYAKGDYAAWWQAQSALRAWDCQNTAFAPTVPGEYVFELRVSDGVDVTEPVRLSLLAHNRETYPSLLLEDLLEGAGPQSNDRQDMESGVGEGSIIGPRQYTFPMNVQQSGSYPLPASSVKAGAETVAKTYRLTAGGGDYTIQGLSASVADAAVGVRFVGLADGQRIRQGESVTFQLVFSMPDPLPDALSNISRSMNWSFQVAEKPGWTFSYTPYIY